MTYDPAKSNRLLSKYTQEFAEPEKEEEFPEGGDQKPKEVDEDPSSKKKTKMKRFLGFFGVGKKKATTNTNVD